MRIMEQAKHLEPKFSESIKELAKYLSEQRVSHNHSFISDSFHVF